MYNISTVQEGLKNLVGFRQPTEPGMNLLDTDLTLSSSGLYFQDVHSLLKLETLFSVAPQFDKYIFDPYNLATEYDAGQKVSSGGSFYRSLVDANVGNLVTDTTKWEEVDLFSEWLEEFKLSAISKVITRTIEAKKIRREVKSIFENLDLYEGWGRTDNVEIKSGRFVFFEFEVKQSSNLNVIINFISTQFNNVQGALNIYVYHSSQSEPIYTIPLVLTKQYSFEKTSISDKVFNYYGGHYYVGYYEDDLKKPTEENPSEVNVQAIKKTDYNWSVDQCGSCNTYNATAYRKWSKYIKIRPGYVSSSYVNEDRTLWDISKNSFDPLNNFGLNFGLSVKCDLSNFIIQQKEIFANAIWLQVGRDLLSEIGNSIRNNIVSQGLNGKAFYALNEKENPDAIPKQLSKSIDALDFDMSGLGECMPCKESMGVRTTFI